MKEKADDGAGRFILFILGWHVWACMCHFFHMTRADIILYLMLTNLPFHSHIVISPSSEKEEPTIKLVEPTAMEPAMKALRLLLRMQLKPLPPQKMQP